jgi:PAS domain S-box-containing protein
LQRVVRLAVHAAGATGAALADGNRQIVASQGIPPNVRSHLPEMVQGGGPCYLRRGTGGVTSTVDECTDCLSTITLPDGVDAMAFIPIPRDIQSGRDGELAGMLCLTYEAVGDAWMEQAARAEDVAALAGAPLARCSLPAVQAGESPTIKHDDLPALFDDAPLLCCTLDASGHMLHVNSELEALSGYQREDLPDARAFVEVLFPDPAVRQRAVDFVKVAPPRWITLEMHTAAGETVTTQWTCVVLPGGRRLALGFDDTERESYEEALRAERDRLATLFRNLPTPVVHGIPQEDTFVVQTLNPAFEAVFDISAEELEQGDLHDAIVPRHEREHAAAINRTLVDESTVRAEVRRIAGGEERDFRVRAALQPGSTDAESEAYAIYTDITDHKAYERKLRDAKERAEEAARLKSAMLANMSHEVRTPLTAIIGFAEILRNALDDENARFAETIRRSSHRLMETLDSVLELSKLDAGAYSLRRTEVNVSDNVRETVEMMTPMAEKAGVSLAVETPEADVRGRLDPGAINRIVTNLISNAIKFTPEAGAVDVRVTFSAEEAGTSVSAVHITVRDTGVGIDPSFIPHLFDAFRQESDGVGRTHEGAGLGLAITKRLAEMMGGTIDVESEKGVGTRFTVVLPLAERV